jgi:hypothetical protein
MNCNICHRLLDQPDDSSTVNCGGTCRRCMAEAGEPDCVDAMRELGLPFDETEAVKARLFPGIFKRWIEAGKTEDEARALTATALNASASPLRWPTLDEMDAAERYQREDRERTADDR